MAGLHKFEASLPGYVSRGLGVLHGAETRTSAPLRVLRDAHTLQSPTMPGLFPLGEGAGYAGGLFPLGEKAGYAGGIVSAAVDGQRAANVLLAELGIAAAIATSADALPTSGISLDKKATADCR